MGTGLQLHVGSIVTSSNSELLKEEVEKVCLFLKTNGLKVVYFEDKKLTFGWR